MNFFLILIDFVFCTQYALVAWHNLLIQLWFAFYALFQMIYITSGGCPAYQFLGLNSPYIPFMLLLILAVGLVFYFFVAGISWHCGACLGVRYVVCDDENSLETPNDKGLDMVFCISCQKRCCSRCGPPRYTTQSVVTRLSSREEEGSEHSEGEHADDAQQKATRGFDRSGGVPDFAGNDENSEAKQRERTEGEYARDNDAEQGHRNLLDLT